MPEPAINVLTRVSWIKNEKVIRHREQKSQCTLSSFAYFTPQHTHPPFFALRLYFTTLLQICCFSHVVLEYHPKLPCLNPQPSCFLLLPQEKKNSLALQCSSCFYQRKERAHGDSWIKSKLEVLWRCHFDVQGIFVFPLFDSLCHFSFCKCKWFSLLLCCSSHSFSVYHAVPFHLVTIWSFLYVVVTGRS